MKKIHLVQYVLLFMSFVGLAGCAAHTNSTTLPGTSEFKSTVWILHAYQQDGNEQNALKETRVTALFDSDQMIISGNSGCNSYSASYVTEGNTLKISGVITTMMTCEENIMRQEYNYLSILEAAERYQIQERQLQIFSREDRALYFTVR